MAHAESIAYVFQTHGSYNHLSRGGVCEIGPTNKVENPQNKV